jgi:hypothetical protein
VAAVVVGHGLLPVLVRRLGHDAQQRVAHDVARRAGRMQDALGDRVVVVLAHGFLLHLMVSPIFVQRNRCRAKRSWGGS